MLEIDNSSKRWRRKRRKSRRKSRRRRKRRGEGCHAA